MALGGLISCDCGLFPYLLEYSSVKCLRVSVEAVDPFEVDGISNEGAAIYSRVVCNSTCCFPLGRPGRSKQDSAMELRFIEYVIE